MGRVTQRMRVNVERQGFRGLSDREIRDLYYWLRVAPLVGAAWTTVGVLSGSPAILWALAPVALSGALVGRHPADAFYMFIVRPRRGTAPIPIYRGPRRFACAMTAVSLGAAGACFFAGATLAGRVLGGVTISIMAFDAATGWCVPSAAWQLVRRSLGTPADTP